tara:strand:+ start:1325 stop:2125 length:801 start_codon:yes stop_codon:yes gene_type:complete
MLENNNSDLWIVTDIDGTLMDHQYDLSPALSTIELLKTKQIPLIFCTSKTAAEVREIRDAIGNRDPFIVENGGAIYGNFPYKPDEWQLVLGRTYSKLRLVLEELSIDIDYKLVALNDLNTLQIQDLTGLKDEQIVMALKREWSVPFLTPPQEYIDKLNKLKRKYDINIYQGNRMSHLLDKKSHKGKAVNKLKEHLKKNSAYVVALGDSHNDIPLLKEADRSIVIPGVRGPNDSLKEGISSGEFILSPEPHGKGWAISVNAIINELL